MKEWVNSGCKQEYLDELNRLEGRGQYRSSQCPSCRRHAATLAMDQDRETPLPTIRCRDCFGGEVVCEGCCLRNHIHNPLHIIEVSQSCLRLSYTH